MIPKNLDGWRPDQFDSRDWDWEQKFSSITPSVEKLPSAFSWRKEMPSLPYQGDEGACTSHSFATMQMFNSLKEGHDVALSPRFMYALTGEPRVGRTFRSHAILLRDVGDGLESSFPNKVELSHEDYCNASLITNTMREEAKQFKIKNWSVITPTRDNLKRAVYRQPIVIAVGGNNTNWASKNSQNIPDNGQADWYHAILLSGWTEDGRWEIANWWKNWGDEQYGHLSADYNITAAYSVEDLPDFPELVEPVEGWTVVYYLTPTRLEKGSEVILKENLNVRDNPAGNKLGVMPKGTKAVIVDNQIISAKLNGDTWLWQKLRETNDKHPTTTRRI